MPTIHNHIVRVPLPLQDRALSTGLAVVDTGGMYLSTFMFLCADSPWAIHQDYLFSESLANANASKRMSDAAEKAMEAGEDKIVISDGDHALLLHTFLHPSPSADTPLLPSIFRLALPIFESIESAK